MYISEWILSLFTLLPELKTFFRNLLIKADENKSDTQNDENKSDTQFLQKMLLRLIYEFNKIVVNYFN